MGKYLLMYEATGKIKLINEVQSFPSGFTKREFVVTTSADKYPQDLKFEVVKDKCAMLDEFEPEQEVVVSFDIRGNEYNGKYFVNLSCWKIQAADAVGTGGGGRSAPASAGGRKSAPPSSSSSWQAKAEGEPSLADLRNENDFDDDIPF